MRNLPENARNRLLNNQAKGQFTGKYVKYLNGMPASVHCMHCGVQVAGYTTHYGTDDVPMTLIGPDGKKTQAVSFQLFNNYAKVRLIMKMPDLYLTENPGDREEGYFIEGKEFDCHPIVCVDCEKIIGDDHAEDLWAVVLNGWHLEMQAKGSSAVEMQAYFDMFKGAVPVRVEHFGNE